MGMLGINMKVVCLKIVALQTLKTNRDQHAKLVQEARDGYIAKAKAELEKRLGDLKEGKLVTLGFKLTVPKDFTTAYNTVIGMLEHHMGDTIELSADEYRHLMQDEWDWTRDFITANSGYSTGTRLWSADKGLNYD